MKNVIDTLSHEGRTLTKHVKYPWTSNYIHDTDTSPGIPPPRAAYYQYPIGVVWYITELGRVYITMETSEMVSMMEMPR